MPMEFNEKLRALRKAHRYSQPKMAEDLGLSQKQISNWELGYSEPGIEDIKKIARYFLISTDTLLGYSIEEMIPDAIKKHAITTQPDPEPDPEEEEKE